MSISAVWLASASQRRCQWLTQHLADLAVGVELTQQELVEDEIVDSFATVRETVAAVTSAKLDAALAELALGRLAHLDWSGPTPSDEKFVVVVADTMVADPDEIGSALGKPVDALGAAVMLRRLSGRRHKVWSGTGIIAHRSAVPQSWNVSRTHGAWVGSLWVESATVEIERLDDESIAGMIRSDSWRGKAGAYDLAGAMAVHAELVDGAQICVLGIAASAISALESLLST